jgi:hypothetical protein
VKVANGGRSNSRVSLWNLSVNFSRTTFVAGQWHIMCSSSPSTDVPFAMFGSEGVLVGKGRIDE